jgi:translation elongation factor EF-G
MGLLYGRAGRLTTQNGGFRRGQGRETTLGDVDAGSSTTDFLDAERERGISIQSAAVTMAIGREVIK